VRVLIDALPLLGEASIATYLSELLQGLDALGPEHTWELLVRGFRRETRRLVDARLGDAASRRFPVRTTRVPDRVLEACWTHRSLRVPFVEAWLGRPDLFLATIYMTPVLPRVPVVMIAYDLIPFRFPQFYGGDRRMLEKRIRRGVERSAAIIAISECTKRDFVDMMGADPSRVHVIYPAVGARFAKRGDAPARARVLARYGVRAPYLLYVGSLGPHKNVGTLIRVFRRLRQRLGLPHQLVLVGKAAWGREVVEAAADLVRAGDCVVLDFIAHDDVPSLYQGAEAFAFLSLWEGFGLPPLEAMTAGVPVVVSSAGSLPEVVGDAGLRVSPTDEGAVEEALGRLLTEPALRAELSARGLRQASRFSWEETARQTLKLFVEVRSGR
jgi:glycosyltransferase involved in cell wall biosynthesis